MPRYYKREFDPARSLRNVDPLPDRRPGPPSDSDAESSAPVTAEQFMESVTSQAIDATDQSGNTPPEPNPGTKPEQAPRPE